MATPLKSTSASIAEQMNSPRTLATSSTPSQRPYPSITTASAASPLFSPLQPGNNRSVSVALTETGSTMKGNAFEDSLLERQRRELQLLIMELKDRDRELNDLVTSHQKQSMIWEAERRKFSTLDKELSKARSEVKKRECTIEKQIAEKQAIKTSEETAKHEVSCLKVRVQQLTEQLALSHHRCQEFETNSDVLLRSIRELSSTVGHLQAREEELIGLQRLKENDLIEANTRIGELHQKLKRYHSAFLESRKAELASRSEVNNLKDILSTLTAELEKTRAEAANMSSSSVENSVEASQLRKEVLVLQQEIILAGERERRKDQLLELSRSKQERLGLELKTAREECEKQQHQLLHLEIQTRGEFTSMHNYDGIESVEDEIERWSLSALIEQNQQVMNGTTANDLTDEEFGENLQTDFNTAANRGVIISESQSSDNDQQGDGSSWHRGTSPSSLGTVELGGL